MKHLLLSLVTPVIFSVIFSVTLTACGGGSAGGGGGGGGDLDSNFTPSNDFTLNPLGTIEEFTAKDVDIPTYKDGENDVAYDSLTKIADDATADNTIDVTLHGLAVMKNDNIAYERENTDIDWKDEANDAELKINRTVTLLRVTAAEKSPAVKLTFGADGAISGVTIYGDEEYTNATADRSNIFDFASDYMAYISWNLAKDRDSLNNTTEDNIYDINGAMLAGIQTADGDIPISGSAEFNGKGKGVYGSETENYNTVFDVTANVNFTARDVDFTFSNTCKIAACADDSADRVTDLDFSTDKIKFAADANTNPTNNISTDVTLTGGLAGKLDARFYGKGDGNFVRELGGTFAFVNATAKNYYYGAFGAQRGNITIPFTPSNDFTLNSFGTIDKFTATAVDIPTYADVDDENNPITVAYTSLTAISTAADAGADDATLDVTLHGLAVVKNDNSAFERENITVDWQNQANDSKLKINREVTLSRITAAEKSPAVTLTFDDEGKISGITAYVDETRATGDTGLTITADRKDIFGFTSNYMAYISWHLAKDRDSLNNTTEDNIYDINGAMIAGIETDAGNIPTENNMTFEGKGKGVYGDGNNDEYETVFDIKADIDVTARTMLLTASNTICPDYNCGINANHLNFSGTLSYKNESDVTVNNATGTINSNGGGLTGTADARFYGSAAQEFGGTFLLANAANKNYYYGAFGGQYAGTETYILNRTVVDLTLDGMASNRNDPENPVKEAVADLNAPTYMDVDDGNKVKYSYESIDDLRNDTSLLDETTLSLTLPVLGTHRYYDINYQRHDNSTNWDNSNVVNTGNIVNNIGSVVTLNYHSKNGKVYFQGKDGKEGIVLYRTTYDADGNEITTRYAANTGVDNRTYFKGNIIGIDSDKINNHVWSHRGDESERFINYFGFVPEYIVGLRWQLFFKKDQLSGTELTDNSYVYFAYLVAGLETGKDFGAGAFGEIPETGNVTFIGKGSGSYGYLRPKPAGDSLSLSRREQVYFNMVANVDFANEKIDFNTYNTCYASNCGIKRKGLDFNTNISFDNTNNNIEAENVTTDNGLLTGKLEARFYGKAAQEFGGSFALIGTNDNNIYYYAIFAGNKTFTDSFSLGDANLNSDYGFLKTANIPYASFAKAAGANEASHFLVLGTAVQKHDMTHYVRKTKAPNWNSEIDGDIISEIQDISLVRTEAPALKLDFDADGNISAIEAYFGFNIYTAVLANGATGLTANGTIVFDENHPDAEAGNITVDRNAFGFTSNYMVYLSWNFAKENLDSDNALLADDKYNINGMMVAGIDTPNMPTSNITNFLGAGKGNYGDKDTDIDHALTFKTFAEVNFGSRKIALEMSDTACVASDCGIDDATLATLDFSKTLTYSADSNSANIGGVNAGSLSGVIHSRFYGTGDNAAGEFGGTFALKDSTHYYYGAFGADKGGTLITSLANSIKDVIIASPETVVIPTKTNGTAYASFRDAIIDNNNPDGKTFRLQGSAVYGGSNAEYNRTAGQDWRELDVINETSATRVVGASASITVTAKKISDITLHLDGKTYSVDTGGTPDGGVFKHTISDANGVTGTLAADRRSAIFGFTPYSIVYVNWSLVKNALADDANTLNDNTYTQRGMMLVGIESRLDQIPLFNLEALDTIMEFKGKGRGYYNSASKVEISRFDINAKVDFANKTVSLSTGNNKLCNLSFGGCKNNYTLNFVTENPISYTSNNVSGKIVSRTYNNPALAVGNFIGTVNAKFYGARANEFGGTFALINNENEQFYGMFGTENKDDPFSYADDKYDTGAVTRLGATSTSGILTYLNHDSFLDAHQDAKTGPFQAYDVSTPSLAAYREDTIRYVRTEEDATAPRTWENSKTDTTIVVANIYNSSAYIRYNGSASFANQPNVPGSIQSARAVVHKISYAVHSNPSNFSNRGSLTEVKTDFTVDPMDYQYATGGNPLFYYKGSGAQLFNFHNSTTGNLTVENPTTFGFQAKYMAYIRWTYEKGHATLGNKTYGTGSDVDGYMVTGFETEDNTNPNANDGNNTDDLPETGTADFVGGGMGTYHHASGQGYRTRFDANADVDFAAGTIDLILNNTRCVAGLGDCDADIATITPELLENLDITNAALSFDKGVNDMTAIAIDTDGGMNGQIDARFYGQNRTGGADKQNAAKEFGGAFSFRDGDKSYIGIFGTCDTADAVACPQPQP